MAAKKQSDDRPSTLGALRASAFAANAGRSVKDEIRSNLQARLRSGERVFDGIVGYDDSVVPAIVNALLAKQNFILLGLRGQAKTRILRSIGELLDPEIPVLADAALHDDPFTPTSHEGRSLVAEQGDDAKIAWLPREARYVEKLATPDVTVADLIGDIDPIKASRLGTQIADERAVHYGLLPRANRGIFAVNELPDLAGKVQVALFNVLQEGDVQIRGFPIRLPLDVLLVFSANPEDYTARGKIVTPLKDRIGSEVRTHYAHTVEDAMRITAQRHGRRAT
jgi:Mg-chelatase subunit ChlI